VINIIGGDGDGDCRPLPGTLYDHDEALKKLDQALGLVNELKSLRYFAPLPKRELREVTSSRVTDPQVAIAEAPATSVPVS
jgi:hypothetical protein